MLKSDVVDRFMPLTAKFEGSFAYFYQDVKGLVTIADGILADPIALAYSLPLLRNSDGAPASRAELEAEWRGIKSLPQLAKWGARAAKQFTRLHLSEDGVRQVVLAKLTSMYDHLVSQYPLFDAWPDDAQLATLLMAWACGEWFGVSEFPSLAVSLRAQDWKAASDRSHVDDRFNAGLVPRNAAIKEFYLSAAAGPAPISDVPPTEPAPVLEDDGGQSRQEATSDAATEGAQKAVDEDVGKT